MNNELVLGIINQIDNIVFWQANHNFTKQIYLSKSFEKIWGRKCEWMLSNMSNWYLSIYDNDIINVTTNTRIRLLQKSDFNLVMYRILLPGNKINYIRDICYKAPNNTFIGFSEQLSASTWENFNQHKILSTNQATFNIAVVNLLKLLFTKNPIIEYKLTNKTTTNNVIHLNCKKTYKEL